MGCASWGRQEILTPSLVLTVVTVSFLSKRLNGNEPRATAMIDGPSTSRVCQAIDRLVCRPKRICNASKCDERRQMAIPVRHLRRGGGVPHDRKLLADFKKKLPEAGLDA